MRETIWSMLHLVVFVLFLEVMAIAGWILASIFFWHLIPFHPLPFLISGAVGVGIWYYWHTDPHKDNWYR